MDEDEKVENSETSERVETPSFSPHLPLARAACCRNGRVPLRFSEVTNAALSPRPPKPWTLPSRGLVVFHGEGDTARLSHYFLPRLLMQGQRVLFLDGANSADPRLLARLARERGVRFEEFSRRIQIARAFTCFQLSELVARVPRFLEEFPAEVLIITAFPDLYFDEDVRDWNARVAFEQALADLRRWERMAAVAAASSPPKLPFAHGDEDIAATTRTRRPLAVAVFSSASTFAPPPARRRFFERLCTAAAEVWEFSLEEDNRVKLLLTTPRARLRRGQKFLEMSSGARVQHGS